MLLQRLVNSLPWLATLVACGANIRNIETVDVDVCIIGGGSSGSYAAVRLQQQGKKVAVVEAQGQLGGHVATYLDPVSSQAIDYGVYILSDTPIVRNFYNHFNIPLTPFSQTPATGRRLADFRTGSLVNSTGPTDADVAAALQRYLAQLQKYQSFTGTLGWNIPSPIPEDLLLPFGDFVTKYNLEAMVGTVFTFLQGAGNLLAQRTLYIMRYFDLPITTDFATGKLVQNAEHNNQLLFDRAVAELQTNGSRVFLSSQVIEVHRSTNSVRVTTNTPAGIKSINASKLLVAVPPKRSNINWLDLSPTESNIFRQFNNSYYYASVVRSNGIPVDVLRLTNYDPAAPLGLPAQPSAFVITATGINDLHGFYYGSTSPISDDKVKAEILRDVQRLETSFGYAGGVKPEIVAYENHSPFQLTVSKEQIEGGFYARLQALQGQKRTWWTGAAWYKPASADLWEFTENEVLPGLLE